NREGTVVAIDPRTGRLRAVVNSQLAFGAAFPPGSTIKPFTTLAALRTHLINSESKTTCRKKYRHAEFEIACSHPTALPPLDPTEAIAYSCNFYFAKLGERLDESAYVEVLREFGFGKKTEVDNAAEVAGVVRGEKWHPETAIGEGAY